MTCEKRWDEMGRAEVRWEGFTWFEMRWSVECEVQGVKSAVSSVKIVFASSCIATWSHAGHVLGQQQRNKFAQSTLARRTAHANSIDEKGLIVKSKATSCGYYWYGLYALLGSRISSFVLWKGHDQHEQLAGSLTLTLWPYSHVDCLGALATKEL